MQTSDLLKCMREEYFLVYGNGFVAKRFYRCIKKYHCLDKFAGIVVTNANGRVGADGKIVRSISRADKKFLILIAVHNANAKEIEYHLANLGADHFIWIYPNLIDLELGEAIKNDCRMNLHNILDRNCNNYVLAIYYLSLVDYCHNNYYDGSLYMKFCSSYIEASTAKKRWESFKRRIDNGIKNGYKQDCNIKINEDCVLIDGFHRVALARYFDIQEIYADMYSGHGEFYTESCAGNILLADQELLKYYTRDESAAIKMAAQEMGYLGGEKND